MWTGEPMDYMIPEDFGYYKDESGQYKITVNDLTDDYYSLPQKVVKGCFCKGTCGGRCQCKKDEDRANKCSRFTCKSCHCYKRIAEVETENVVLSSRFQDYLDGMSSSSSSSDESKLRSDTETDDSISVEYDTDYFEEDHLFDEILTSDDPQ